MNPSYPQDLLELLKQALPDEQQLAEMLDYNSRPLRTSIRLNPLKCSRELFIARANELGWQLTPIPWCEDGFWVELPAGSVSIGNNLEHIAGQFYVQEASSMLPVAALAAHYSFDEDSVVLDAAAAPGSKTTQIAALMANQGALVANEYSASRIKVLSANLQRCGVNNVAISHFSAEVFGSWTPKSFDAILLDAPCSGEGTLRKDPDALKNWSLQHVEETAELQVTLFESALQALKPGGTLVYSTCTLNPLENQGVINAIMERYPDALTPIDLSGLFEGAELSATAEGYLHVWPHVYDSEGFFLSAFTRSDSELTPEPVEKKLKPLPFKPLANKPLQELSNYLRKQFGLTLPNSHTVFSRDKELWLFPNAILPLTDEMRFQRIGIRLGELLKVGFKMSHEFATSLASSAEINRVDLDIEQAKLYFAGRDVPYPNNHKGELVVCYQGTPIGMAKWVKNKLKNSLPRDLVRNYDQLS